MTKEEIHKLDQIRDRLVMLAVNIQNPQRQDKLLRIVYQIGRILEEAQAEIELEGEED